MSLLNTPLLQKIAEWTQGIGRGVVKLDNNIKAIAQDFDPDEVVESDLIISDSDFVKFTLEKRQTSSSASLTINWKTANGESLGSDENIIVSPTGSSLVGNISPISRTIRLRSNYFTVSVEVSGFSSGTRYAEVNVSNSSGKPSVERILHAVNIAADGGTVETYPYEVDTPFVRFTGDIGGTPNTRVFDIIYVDNDNREVLTEEAIFIGNGNLDFVYRVKMPRFKLRVINTHTSDRRCTIFASPYTDLDFEVDKLQEIIVPLESRTSDLVLVPNNDFDVRSRDPFTEERSLKTFNSLRFLIRVGTGLSTENKLIVEWRWFIQGNTSNLFTESVELSPTPDVLNTFSIEFPVSATFLQLRLINPDGNSDNITITNFQLIGAR